MMIATEVVSRIPAIDRTRVGDTVGKTHSELLELVPEIHQLELDNAFAEASEDAKKEPFVAGIGSSSCQSNKPVAITSSDQ